MRRAGAELRIRCAVSQSRGDGAAWFRPRRVQVLRLSVAAAGGGAAGGALSAARGARQPLERSNGDRSALSAGARELPRALPEGGADQANAAAAAVRRRRLQLPAPGSLRRARVSPAGHAAVVAAGR